MRKLLTLSLAGAALAAAGVAVAQPAATAPRTAEMTRDQVQARAAEAFARLDRNNDGKLDLADREAAQAERQKAAFDRADADHNGAISYAEFTAQREQRGDRMAPRQGRGGERFGGWRGARGDRFAGGRGGPGGGARLLGADVNKDGAVTRDEFASAMLARFDQADANKDGKVTRDERRSGLRDRRGPAPAPATT